jgi:hypothetical protein
MAKKIIIIILIFLILISLGVIGYLMLSSNNNIDLSKFWPFGSKTAETVPLVPINFFPTASSTQDSSFITANPASNPPPASETETNPQAAEDQILSGTSALGLIVTTNSQTKTEQVFFVDRKSGNLYEITANNDLLCLTGETLSDLQEVYWGQDKAGQHLITRLAKFNQLITVSGLIKKSDSADNLGTINNQILGTNISALAVSPNGSQFFTLETTTGGGVTGYLNDWTGKNKKKVWSFQFGDWQINWPKDNLISLTTTPSGSEEGYLYFLNPTTGALTKILKGVKGLTANVAPDDKKLIYTSHSLSGLATYLYNVATQKTVALGLNTLPEKCLWADKNTLYCAVPRNIPNGLYPDNWYQGKITFVDDIWKIDLSQTQPLTTLAIQLKSSYDLVNLTLAPKRGWLYAINKTDSSIQAFALGD